MPSYSGFSGLVRQRQLGTGGFLSAQSAGGANPYFDYGGSTFGSGLLPGGNLRASPSQTGQARSIPGVEFPVAGYPETGWNPNQRIESGYQNSIPGVGLPYRGEIGGGPGGTSGMTPFDPMGYGSNPSPYRDVMPSGERYYPNSGSTGGTTPRRSGYDPNNSDPIVTPRGYYYDGDVAPPTAGAEYQDWVGAGYNTDANGNIIPSSYPGYQPPVARAVPVQPTGLWGRLTGQPQGNYTYPIPGVGTAPARDWQQNARGGSGMGLFPTFGSIANSIGRSFGFGGGLTSAGGGGWQQVSGFPEYSGFAGAGNARAMAGPLIP